MELLSWGWEKFKDIASIYDNFSYIITAAVFIYICYLTYKFFSKSESDIPDEGLNKNETVIFSKVKSNILGKDFGFLNASGSNVYFTLTDKNLYYSIQISSSGAGQNVKVGKFKNNEWQKLNLSSVNFKEKKLFFIIKAIVITDSNNEIIFMLQKQPFYLPKAKELYEYIFKNYVT